jgi:diacylglycerol kinase (ATP)
MRLALIANDASGSGTDVEGVADLLRRGGASVSIHDIRDLDETAVAVAAPDRVVVAGGDGSVGAAAVVAAGRGVPLAVIPTGTANDFARALDLPLEVDRAAELAATPDARRRTVDLHRAGEHPFLNAASAGLSVLAARHAHPLKPALGPLAYAVGALRAGLSATPLRARVLVDGRELFAGRAWQVIVAGTGAFGGGSELEEADPGDGLLDVAVLEAGSRAALVRRAYGMRAGGLTDQGGVHHGRGRTVELELPQGSSLNVDGELCERAPTRFESRGERVEVVAP